MFNPSSQRPKRVKSPLSRSIIQFFQNKSTIDSFMNQFFLPKQHDYNQHVLQFYSNTHNFTQQHHDIPNKQGQKLYASLFYKITRQQQNFPQTCIVYCHGFGSTRLEAVHLLKVLKEDIALCCFDFSGAGKSEGSIITYGAKEKQDIYSVITYLKKTLKFSKFILWGRSMGATACLLYSLKYEQSQQIAQRNVLFQVIDSPFASFQKIVIQMAKKFISMPQFGTSIVLDMMRKNCEQLQSYNPFKVDLSSIAECKVPTLFIYSETDDIVSCKNSEYLCEKFTGFYQKIIIQQNHNSPRAAETLSQVIKKIQIQLKKCQISKKNGGAFRSFMSTQYSRNRNNKKGIQRSSRKEESAISQIEKPQSSTKNSDYGLQLNSKCQTPNPHSYGLYDNEMQHQDRSSSKPVGFSTLSHDYNFQNYQSPFSANTLNQTPRKNQLKDLNSITTYSAHKLKDFRSTIYCQKIDNSVKKSPSMHSIHQNEVFKNGQPKESQIQQNIYQMRKLNVIRNKKDPKKLSSPRQSFNQKNDNPSTHFIRQNNFGQKIKDINYRDSQRRPSSALQKLNISLSKLKDVKEKHFISPLNKESSFVRPINEKRLQAKEKQYKEEMNNSPYVLSQVKNSIRPTSVNTQIYLPKYSYQTTTVSKSSSLSSSMDNLHFLGAIKAPSHLKKGLGKQNNINNDNQANDRRCVKKIRSSEIIYFDKTAYKYGI